MALTEREQQLLAELERNFYATEADVVETSKELPAPNHKAIVVGALLILLGLGLLVGAVSLRIPVIGVAGFAVMVFGVLQALKPGSKKAVSVGDSAKNQKMAASSSGRESLTQKLERRWHKRFGEDY